MRAVVTWTDHAPQHGGVKSVCYDIAFRPDGSQLIAAVGSRVLMYDAANGDLLHSLQGHKDSVYCVAYSRDGKRFASGGADKTIIIWTHKAEGILKYSHSDSVQCLAYNPITQQLASGTATDFGIWSPEQKSVSKNKAHSKVLCAAWTADGQHLALGMYSGHISICNKSGTQQLTIERSAPVWTLQWNTTQHKTSDALAVGCWDGTLSIYDLAGKQVGNDKELGFDPCCVAYHDAMYLCVGGSDKKVLLYSRDGVKLMTMCETGDWIWTVRSRPKHDYVVVGCNDGSISMLQLIFSTISWTPGKRCCCVQYTLPVGECGEDQVHGLYQEHYAFREAMTDVVIQNLIEDEKVRIRCRDYIKKIAVYQERVAVQLSNSIVVYEKSREGCGSKSQYRACARIDRLLECNLLVLTADHVTLCQETKLQLLTLSGCKEREWLLESTIKYIKVCGGPRGGEGLLIGMKNGLIVKVWINSNYPSKLYKHTSGIRCLDISSSRNCLAIVDECANVLVYNLQTLHAFGGQTKEVNFEDKLASSVAWNTQMESMLCYSGSGMLNIKTANFPVHRQKLQGYVVGFQGSKVFCLHHLSMQTIEVPLSTSMWHYIESSDYVSAYQVACLGVTEADWHTLALSSLQGQAWDVARKGFIRVQNVCYLDLLNWLQQGHGSHFNKSTLTALVLAYEGKFKEAANTYVEEGQVEKAMEMYSDLRMFEEAKALARTTSGRDVNDTSSDREANVQEIIQRQAEWTEKTNDPKTAADMYLIASQPEKALALLAEHGPVSKLIEVARRLKKTKVEELTLCATLMRRGGQYAHALETYTKLGDFRSILSLHVELHQWEEAFSLKMLHPELEDNVTLQYAQWLIHQDHFNHARIAFTHAGRPDLSEHLLKQLIQNAVKERRFKDAAQLCRTWALEILEEVAEASRNNLPQEEEKRRYKEYCEHKENADLYYAYSFIDQSISEPFRTTMPEILFNIARFLLSRCTKQTPQGISLVNILVTLAEHSRDLGCYKVARHAYGRLQCLQVPDSWVDKLEVATLAVRAKAGGGCEETAHMSIDIPMCYSCSSPLPLVSQSSDDTCSVCLQPFFRSFLTFDHIPLLEFTLDEGITHEQAMELITSHHSSKNPTTHSKRVNELSNHGSSDHRAGVNILGLRNFLGQKLLCSASSSEPGLPQVNQDMLANFIPWQVLVLICPAQYEKPRYFHVVDPTLALCRCSSCHHFFEQEEWDLVTSEQPSCPFCGTPVSASGESTAIHTPSSSQTWSLLEHTNMRTLPLLCLPPPVVVGRTYQQNSSLTLVAGGGPNHHHHHHHHHPPQQSSARIPDLPKLQPEVEAVVGAESLSSNHPKREHDISVAG